MKMGVNMGPHEVTEVGDRQARGTPKERETLTM